MHKKRVIKVICLRTIWFHLGVLQPLGDVIILMLLHVTAHIYRRKVYINDFYHQLILHVSCKHHPLFMYIFEHNHFLNI